MLVSFISVAGYVLSLSATAPHFQGRTRALHMGLLDWMLDNPLRPPADQLCRSEGWDLICRLQLQVVHERDGPKAYHSALNLGVRFADDADDAGESELPPRGTVQLVASSPQISSTATNRWQTTEVAEDGVTPTAIQWSLTTSETGIVARNRRTGTEDGVLVPPDSELCFTIRLDPSEGTLLTKGQLWLLAANTDEVEGLTLVGTCEASPMPLMGSN